MNFYLHNSSIVDRQTHAPAALFAGACSLERTRTALQYAAEKDEFVTVVGWLDLTSAHLIDLLDDVRSVAGGHKLSGLRGQLSSQALDLPTQRGLATLENEGLALWLPEPEALAVRSVTPRLDIKPIPSLFV